MGDFILNTSGAVHLGPDQLTPNGFEHWHWRYLDVFTQGYIEAMARDGASLLGDGDPYVTDFAFSDLAPEALALILKDCAEVAPDGGLRGHLPTNASAVADARGAGAEFWRRRNKLVFKRFPPLTPYLGDDGKVHLRAAA